MPVVGSARKRFKKLEQKIAKYNVFCCILMYDSMSQPAILKFYVCKISGSWGKFRDLYKKLFLPIPNLIVLIYVNSVTELKRKNSTMSLNAVLWIRNDLLRIRILSMVCTHI